MKTGAWLVVCLLGLVPALAAAADPPAAGDAVLFRVFLKDGSSLASVGELTVVADRVIFSMPAGVPIAPGAAHAPLQLVNIPSAQVDWIHTNRYAESARASIYFATRAQADYAQLSNEVAKALNAVSLTTDPSTRLTIVENARRMLAEWPATHYNFNQTEVQQLLSFLDEAIADLQVSSGGRFSLSLVSTVGAVPPREALLPPPTLKEVVEQMLVAAGLAESPMERSSLLATALNVIRGEAAQLPAEWAAATALAVRNELAEVVQVEREYQLFSQKTSRAASDLARAADVRGIERLLSQIRERDAALGNRRPDMVASLNVVVGQQLDAARRLQLERDHWNLRIAAFRKYNAAVAASFERFALLKPSLDDIQALSGSTPTTLAAVDRLSGQIVRALSLVTPPAELEAPHALLVSAAQLADSAGRIRREAAETMNVERAWDASSAAAGSLMLSARARSEIQMRLRLPQLPQ